MLRAIFRGATLPTRLGSCQNLNSVRTLYLPSVIGMDGYERQRSITGTRFHETADQFKQKMQDFSEDSSKDMVFSEDVKNIVHLARKEDLPLVVKMLDKFVTQNKEMRFSSFVFGPVVMRMFCHLEDVDTALQLFKDEKYADFFNQWMSYQILCDMLYERQRYQEVLDIFEVIKGRLESGLPRYTIVIVFGACYKLNTPESYKYAMDLWQMLLSKGHPPIRRVTTFMAGLALKQNEAHVALELLHTTTQQNYITVRNLKVLAMLEMNRVTDCVPILRSVLEMTPDQSLTKRKFCVEVLEKMRAAMETHDDKELKLDFERIDKYLVEHGHVSEKSLEELICAPIEVTKNNSNERNNNQVFINASFNGRRDGNYGQRRDRNQGYQQRQEGYYRPGIKDMY